MSDTLAKTPNERTGKRRKIKTWIRRRKKGRNRDTLIFECRKRTIKVFMAWWLVSCSMLVEIFKWQFEEKKFWLSKGVWQFVSNGDAAVSIVPYCSFGFLARSSRGARVLRTIAHRALSFFRFLHAYSASIPVVVGNRWAILNFQQFCIFFFVSFTNLFSIISSYFLSLSSSLYSLCLFHSRCIYILVLSFLLVFFFTFLFISFTLSNLLLVFEFHFFFIYCFIIISLIRYWLSLVSNNLLYYSTKDSKLFVGDYLS